MNSLTDINMLVSMNCNQKHLWYDDDYKNNDVDLCIYYNNVNLYVHGQRVDDNMQKLPIFR